MITQDENGCVIDCGVALRDCDALMPCLMTLTLAARLMQIEY